MTATFSVWGNHGTLSVCTATGDVLSLDVTGADNPKEYATIVRFDVAEYRTAYPAVALDSGRVDVVDIGFWSADGSYDPPEADHRELVRDAA